jgi:hypothetical protein
MEHGLSKDTPMYRRSIKYLVLPCVEWQPAFSLQFLPLPLLSTLPKKSAVMSTILKTF